MLGAEGWPIIGRSEELELVVGAIKPSSDAAGVAIIGAMGVGKSRLAREALAACGPLPVNWAAGSSAAQAIPLGAFVRWLPSDAHDPLRATNLVISELRASAGARSCVVVVDDAHLLDDTSAFMLQQLIERRLAQVVLTVSSGVAVSDAVAALWRAGELRRVDLQPLSHAECAELLETVLRGPVDPVSHHRMWRLTRGNVRFMRHIVDQELDSGRLHFNDGMWTWLPGAVIPSPVCELIEHQIGELPDAVAETVDVLSVAGPLTARILVDIVGAGPMEDAEQRALITVDSGDDAIVRLAHPLIAEVRRMKAGHIRLRRLRGTVAARLEASDDPSRILRRGVLLLESDSAATETDLLRAGEAALWRGDHALALRLAEAARASGGGWKAALVCAEAHSMAGRLDSAQALLADVDAPADAGVSLAAGRAKNLFLRGRTDEALAEVGDGVSAGLDAMRAFLTAYDRDPDDAVRIAEAALRSDALPDVSAMMAQCARVVAAGELGRTDDVDAAAAAGHDLGNRAVATSFLRFALAEAHSSALQLAGHPEAAAAVVDRVREDDQPPDVDRWVSMMNGSVSLATGRVDIAVNQLRGALSSSQDDFLGGWLYRYDLDLAIALTLRGDTEAAKRRLRRASSRSHPDMAILEPMEMLATAWISAADGIVTRAISEARTAAVAAATRGLPAREVVCLQTATRFGDATTVARLEELAHIVGGRRVTVAARHAAALAAGDGEGLMKACELYAAIGDMLSALDAAAQASGVFRRAGRRGSALGASGRVRELQACCGGRVRTPAVSDAAAPPGFTGREREVIILAGNGLSNREIADRLQLSVRTVEGHLYRAATRVGARDRNELARVIGKAFAVPA